MTPRRFADPAAALLAFHRHRVGGDYRLPCRDRHRRAIAGCSGQRDVGRGLRRQGRDRRNAEEDDPADADRARVDRCLPRGPDQHRVRRSDHRRRHHGGRRGTRSPRPARVHPPAAGDPRRRRWCRLCGRAGLAVGVPARQRDHHDAAPQLRGRPDPQLGRPRTAPGIDARLRGDGPPSPLGHVADAAARHIPDLGRPSHSGSRCGRRLHPQANDRRLPAASDRCERGGCALCRHANGTSGRTGDRRLGCNCRPRRQLADPRLGERRDGGRLLGELRLRRNRHGAAGAQLAGRLHPRGAPHRRAAAGRRLDGGAGRRLVVARPDHPGARRRVACGLAADALLVARTEKRRASRETAGAAVESA